MQKTEALIVREIAEQGDLPIALEMLNRFPLPAAVRNLVSYLLYKTKRSNRNYQIGLIDHKENLEISSQNAFKLFEVLTEIEAGRMETFIGHMVQSGFFGDEVLSGNKEFVHAFSQTLNKVLETNRSEKIEYFSNLLKNTFKGNDKVNMDEYEFNLKALDGLNFIEIQLLVMLFKYEQSIGAAMDIPYKRLQKMSRAWLDFIAKVEEELNLDREECEAYFYSIEKSGMVNFQKQRLDESKHYGACTTVLFWRLYEKIINESEAIKGGNG